jgi:hypothetical protein
VDDLLSQRLSLNTDQRPPTFGGDGSSNNGSDNDDDEEEDESRSFHLDRSKATTTSAAAAAGTRSQNWLQGLARGATGRRSGNARVGFVDESGG